MLKLLRKISIPHPEMTKRNDVFQIAEIFPHFLEILQKIQNTKALKRVNSNENYHFLSSHFSICYPKRLINELKFLFISISEICIFAMAF